VIKLHTERQSSVGPPTVLRAVPAPRRSCPTPNTQLVVAAHPSAVLPPGPEARRPVRQARPLSTRRLKTPPPPHRLESQGYPGVPNQTRAYPPTMKCAQTDHACARGMHYARPSEGVEPTPHSGPPGCGRAHPAPARRPTPSDGSLASDPLVVVELTPEAMQGWNVRAVGRTRT